MKNLIQKRTTLLSITLLLSTYCSLFAGDVRHRLIVLADMGNEPDEEQQMTHMMVCSNEFDIDALIAVTGKYIHPGIKDPYRQITHPELFHKIIDAYEEVLPNLKKHADGWQNPDDLRQRVAAGQKEYGMQDVGAGKSSQGSELIINAVLKDDPRPIWVVVNAGSNTLAQALWDFRASHTQKEVEAFIAKLRVFENGAQDNAGAWITSTFPTIFWIRSNYQTYAYGGPGGVDGSLTRNIGPHYWKPYEYSTKGQNDWLKEHVMTGHGALGDVFPERRWEPDGHYGFMEGGGTLPWMGLVNKGLFDINSPHWGGWSGRYSREKVACFWSRHGDIRVDEEKVAPFYTYREVSDYWIDTENGDTLSGDYVPAWRWRKAMYNDFICRMDWCVKSYENANHHPKAVFNGDDGDDVIRFTALPGDTIQLDASGSKDPDNDPIHIKWWQYLEAGTYAGKVNIPNPNQVKTQIVIPTGAAGTQIHIILEIQDQNKISSLFDYLRIVIDVEDMYNHNLLFKQKT